MHGFFWIGVSGFLGYNDSSGTAGSKGSSLFSLLFVALFIMAILNGARCYLIVALICISLMASNAEHLFIVSGPSVCPPWRNVCLSPLPVF